MTTAWHSRAQPRDGIRIERIVVGGDLRRIGQIWVRLWIVMSRSGRKRQ